MNYIREWQVLILNNKLMLTAMYMILLDTVFGCIRAARERKVNSAIGIDGLIRKFSMMLCMVFCVPFDSLCGINAIGFIPDDITQYLPGQKIGFTEIFCLLFLAFEMLSVLKNMYLCGLPVKRVWVAVYKFLSKYTDELPIKDEDLEEIAEELDNV